MTPSCSSRSPPLRRPRARSTVTGLGAIDTLAGITLDKRRASLSLKQLQLLDAIDANSPQPRRPMVVRAPERETQNVSPRRRSHHPPKRLVLDALEIMAKHTNATLYPLAKAPSSSPSPDQTKRQLARTITVSLHASISRSSHSSYLKNPASL